MRYLTVRSRNLMEDLFLILKLLSKFDELTCFLVMSRVRSHLSRRLLHDVRAYCTHYTQPQVKCSAQRSWTRRFEYKQGLILLSTLKHPTQSLGLSSVSLSEQYSVSDSRRLRCSSTLTPVHSRLQLPHIRMLCRESCPVSTAGPISTNFVQKTAHQCKTVPFADRF